ncbi:MAG: glycosyltransferase family 2 protein [Selenomonadaceae bacterium]|nr:glycosyltransferase family 2 protein [Selenomonadaceae bacterium]
MEILFEHEIAIALIVKNESPYIEEWLEYHYKIGIDRFYIYDNDSEDRSELKKILEPWIAQKIVEYVEFPGNKSQMIVYDEIVYQHRFDCRYIGFLDADEFLVPKQNRSLLEIVDEIFKLPPPPENLIAGFGINWRIFGSNGQDRKIDGGVLERFTLRNPDSLKANLHVKTIVNPRRVYWYLQPHNPIYYSNCLCVNENGRIIQNHENLENTAEKIQINHYFTKSREEFEIKRLRGRADIGKQRRAEEFDIYQHDKINDTLALEIFNRPSFRQIDFHDDESTIQDLESMLNVDSDNLEKFFTCFHRARGLKDSKIREEFTSLAINRILQPRRVTIPDCYLFVDSVPEIISARPEFKKVFIQNEIIMLKQLEDIMRKRSNLAEYIQIWHRREILQAII